MTSSSSLFLGFRVSCAGCESGYWPTFASSSSSSYLGCVKVNGVHFVFYSILTYLLEFFLSGKERRHLRRRMARMREWKAMTTKKTWLRPPKLKEFLPFLFSLSLCNPIFVLPYVKMVFLL